MLLGIVLHAALSFAPIPWSVEDSQQSDFYYVLASRTSVVAPAKRSESAKRKDATRVTPEGLPVQSFQDLLKDMARRTRNSIRFESSASEFQQPTESTTLQRRVFDLLSTHTYPDYAYCRRPHLPLFPL